MAEQDIHCPEELMEHVERYGILPLFDCCVKGLSASEMTPGGLWFSDDGEGGHGLWSWKMPAIQSRRCTYGQFFGGKKGFVSLGCLPDFINWRRSLPVTRNEDKLELEKAVQDIIAMNGAMTKAEIRTAMGYGLKRMSAADLVDARAEKRLPLDSLLTDLQKSCRIVISELSPRVNRFGEEDRYGWQIAHFDTPENVFGPSQIHAGCAPEESRQRLIGHLRSLLPDADEKALRQLV